MIQLNYQSMNIARGYEPVAKLDINVMASNQALSKMGFATLEIDKIDAVAKAKKYFLKRSHELAKLSKKGKVKSEKSHSASPEYPICDICGNPTIVSGVKLTSPAQEMNIPPEWAPFQLNRLGSPSYNNYRAYILLPPGIVIDYQSRKVYVVCGNCRVVLGLRTTESEILIHNRTEGTGYGFVNLDKVEKLIQIYKSAGCRIELMIDFNVAVEIDKFWEKQSDINL